MSQKLSTQRHTQLKEAVIPFSKMEDLPASVLDQIAKINRTLPVIFVIYAGGTIGMDRLESDLKKVVYTPSDDAQKLLAPLSFKGLEKNVQVIWVPVIAIDSTNGRWPHWVSIANAIHLLYDMGTGFVICHGTDTMAEMCMSMEIMFPNIGKPIIATGAQVPMIELGDDGTNNLYFSITAAASDLSGVYLMFGDELMEGGHIHKTKDKRRKAFECPPEYLHGHYDDNLRIYPMASKRMNYINSERLIFNPHFREGIKVIEMSAGTPSESLLYDAKDPLCDALILITFGAGNVRDKEIITEEKNHIDCLWELFQQKYPVVLGSPMQDGEIDSPYEGGVRAVSTKEGDGNAISGKKNTGPRLKVLTQTALEYGWNYEKDCLDYTKFKKCVEEYHKGWSW